MTETAAERREPRAPRHFEVCGPLPGPGVTVLEASAGTGKTYTIAALVARFVAEGVPVSEILAVTFTRMATGELRDRVRARMVSAEDGLSRCLEAAELPQSGDPVLCLLAKGTTEEVSLRRDRLATALRTFDEATITTTHGFCQLMLAGLGVAGDVATGATLLEDPADLVEETVDDLYVRWTLFHGELPPFSRSQALEIAQEAVGNPGTPLEPEAGSTPSGIRRRLAEGVRQEVERRLREANLLTFDDLLVRLKETLADPRRGATASDRLRARYSVVLVDEFQDTDPVQWDVVRRAFGTGSTRLVLIGDPKQAIYAFRGADVYAYLDAAEVASSRYTLAVNWRSDADLLAAFDALLEPLQLGHPEILFRPVRAAPAHQRAGLRGSPVSSPLRARIVFPKEHGLSFTKHGDVEKRAATDWIVRDLASDVVGLLEAGAEIVEFGDDGAERGCRQIAPGDAAVLVGTNRQARIVQEALRSLGVPAVVAGVESVLSTRAARDWLCLLEALEQPASRSRAVAVALTPFFDMPAAEVASAGEADWEGVHTRLHRWSDTLRRRGVASLFRSVIAGEAVPGRILRDRDGERHLTDLGHVAQLLHAEASEGQHGAPALRAWLARRIDEAESGKEGAEAEVRSRWLDSDAEAVQVLTVHRSKGLEFPIVYCPFLWDEFSITKGRPVVYHDPADGRRKVDVSGSDGGSDYDAHLDICRAEDRGEALRELYVALTRARHQVVVWWVRSHSAHLSSLGRLLMVREPDGSVATSAKRKPRDEEIWARFEEVAARAPEGLVSVERSSRPEPAAKWSGRAGGSLGPLGTAPFDRSLDLKWRRTSYSGITAAVHGGPAVGSEPEERATSDEPERGTVPEMPDGSSSSRSASDEHLLRSKRSLWADLPGGVDMGTFVHRVLEEVDFTASDLRAEIVRAVALLPTRFGFELGSTDELVAALEADMRTPLGPLAGGISLSDIGRRDRIDEMGFELPVAGGDRPSNTDAVATGDIARLFELHTSRDGPLSGYAERLRDPMLGTSLRGYLTGSLDLVFRVGGDAGALDSYFVADYKTNWIGAEGEELSAWQYRPAMLDVEMQRMHYPLQALLYVVALHRYLRWRVPGYEPETHLGGVLYLFLRGMAGPATPVVDGCPCGVFAWRPPAALVTDLSDLLEAGS